MSPRRSRPKRHACNIAAVWGCANCCVHMASRAFGQRVPRHLVTNRPVPYPLAAPPWPGRFKCHASCVAKIM
eukprot:33179-Pyramimonas_sp.AAC.1